MENISYSWLVVCEDFVVELPSGFSVDVIWRILSAVVFITAIDWFCDESRWSELLSKIYDEKEDCCDGTKVDYSRADSVFCFIHSKRLEIFSTSLSFFIPVFLIWFLVNFNAYVWKKDAKKLPILRVIPTLFWLLTAELSMIPAMHTVVVWIIGERIKKRQHSKASVSIFKKFDIEDSSVGKLHGELR